MTSLSALPFPQRVGVVLIVPKEEAFDKLFWQPPLPHRLMDNDALIEVALEDLNDAAVAAAAHDDKDETGSKLLDKYGDKIIPSIEARISVQEAKGEPFVPGQGVNVEFSRLWAPHYGLPLSAALGSTHRLLAGIEGSKYCPPYFSSIYPNCDLVGFAAIGGVEKAKDGEGEGDDDERLESSTADVFPVLWNSTASASVSRREALRLARTASRELLEEAGIFIAPSFMLELLATTAAAILSPRSEEPPPLILYTGPSPYYEKKSIVVLTLILPSADRLRIKEGKIVALESKAAADDSNGGAGALASPETPLARSAKQSRTFAIASTPEEDEGKNEGEGGGGKSDFLALLDGSEGGITITHPKYLGRRVIVITSAADGTRE